MPLRRERVLYRVVLCRVVRNDAVTKLYTVTTLVNGWISCVIIIVVVVKDHQAAAGGGGSLLRFVKFCKELQCRRWLCNADIPPHSSIQRNPLHSTALLIEEAEAGEIYSTGLVHVSLSICLHFLKLTSDN